MYMRPVFRLRWKRFGARLCKQHRYVKNAEPAICKENCLRMSHIASGVRIDLIMYLNIS
jgi:hypothetical protein